MGYILNLLNSCLNYLRMAKTYIVGPGLGSTINVLYSLGIFNLSSFSTHQEQGKFSSY